mgnify:CR=1 FL=1
MTAIRHCSSRVRKGTSTPRACCLMRVPRLISGVRVIGRRLGLRAPLGTSTWRRYWWSEVLTPLQSTHALAERRRFRSLAITAASTRCGCCWRKVRRSTAKQKGVRLGLRLGLGLDLGLLLGRRLLLPSLLLWQERLASPKVFDVPRGPPHLALRDPMLPPFGTFRLPYDRCQWQCAREEGIRA